MRYLTYEKNGQARLGVLTGSDIIDVSAIEPNAPGSMVELISAGHAFQERIREGLPAATSRIPLESVRLLAPLLNPGKIICLGLNYVEHAKEGGHAIPDYPALFMRANTSLIGPDEPMIVPSCSAHLDFEAELAIVVGTRCRHVREEDADSAIFGYTIFNDGSVRDYQRKSAQWTAGKNFDGTGSMGPWIVTSEELPVGARGLGLRTRLNGRIMQDSNTDQMIFNTHRIIAILSEVMTLEPGDLIATGTPSGVGHARNPQVWMRPGDTVEVEVEGIGKLTNPVQAEVPLRATA